MLTLHTDNTQYCITNGKGYFSRSMSTGKPVFLPSKGLCYTYPLAQAQTIADSIKTDYPEVTVIKY